MLQVKRTNLKKPSSERTGHGLRVKFNPLALLLDASLEGEFDLVQRIIYEVTKDYVVVAVLVLQYVYLIQYVFFQICTAYELSEFICSAQHYSEYFTSHLMLCKKIRKPILLGTLEEAIQRETPFGDICI